VGLAVRSFCMRLTYQQSYKSLVHDQVQYRFELEQTMATLSRPQATWSLAISLMAALQSCARLAA
jgi:hypothetical protein